MMLRLCAAVLTLLAGCVAARADLVWRSEVVGRDLPVTITSPTTASTRPASRPGVIVLRNLPEIDSGDDANRLARSRLTEAGLFIVEIDYAHDRAATAEALTNDLLKLRSDLKSKTLALGETLDIDRVWIVPEGVALRRDVTFFEEDGRTWQLDLAYPVAPARPAATLVEITCDNAKRMGNGSLVFCRDTLLEGALLRGFAAAMIDHPVPAPYKGIDDPMPQLIHRVKSAVRTIRAAREELPLSGTIGAIGFSRGGPMAALLAVTNGRPEFDVGGIHAGISSDIQAALVHGNRYDYAALREDDPMLARFEKAWGPLESNRERWLAHGAVHHLGDSAAPMFLNTSDTESPEFRDGLEQLHNALTRRGIRHVYQVDADGRGHRVSTDAPTLGRMYDFFKVELGAGDP